MKRKRSIGIIGGMGSYASAFLYELLLNKSRELFGAKNNDDYPEIVIDSLPVPDFISNSDNLPVAKRLLVSRTRRLRKFGCSKIYMACNSGHVVAKSLTKASGGRFVSLIDLVVKEVVNAKKNRIGILGSPTTKENGLYVNIKDLSGIEMFYPSEKHQLEIETIIRSVISNECNLGLKNNFSMLTRQFVEEYNLDLIVLGCTELPLVFPKKDFLDITIVDSLDVLATNILSNYYG